MLDPLGRKGGFADLVGYHLSDWRQDRATVTMTVEERHLNRSGFMHGGVLATLIDTVCGYSGTYAEGEGKIRRAFTLALNTQFVAPAEAGDRLTASARRTGGGRRTYFSRAEVRDQDGRLVGQGEGVFQLRPGSEAGGGETAKGRPAK